MGSSFMRFFTISVSLLFYAQLGLASLEVLDFGAPKPPCPNKQGIDLPLNAQQVSYWKKKTQNAYLDRAHLAGEVSRLYPDRSGHKHFEITFGNQDETDTIEVIYNEAFGSLPSLEMGLRVEVCGDYITANRKTGPYPPSPNGAIVHWVHKNPNGNGHPSGYVEVEGVLYGQDTTKAHRRDDELPEG